MSSTARTYEDDQKLSNPAELNSPGREGAEEPKAVNVLNSVNDLIYSTGVVVVVLTLSCMFLALFINVVLRYVFGSGIAWAYEIHNILFPWMVSGGAVMATAKGSNIAITAITDVLPESVRRVMAIAINAFVAVLCVAVVDSSIPIIKAAQYSRLAETGISQMYGYVSLLYAFGAMALLSAIHVGRLVMGEKAEVSDPTSGNFS